MKVAFTVVQRIVGNPETFLFGAQKGRLLRGASAATLAGYCGELFERRKSVPARLLFVHRRFLEAAGCGVSVRLFGHTKDQYDPEKDPYFEEYEAGSSSSDGYGAGGHYQRHDYDYDDPDNWFEG